MWHLTSSAFKDSKVAPQLVRISQAVDTIVQQFLRQIFHFGMTVFVECIRMALIRREVAMLILIEHGSFEFCIVLPHISSSVLTLFAGLRIIIARVLTVR